MSKKEVFILNGYRLIYEPHHPRALKGNAYNGYVYEHIYVAEKYLGRPLRDDEEVHHLDENKANNRYANLLVIPNSQHPKIHNWIKSGCPVVTKENLREWPEVKYCLECKRTIQDPRYKEYCSLDCYNEQRPSRCPPKQKLQDDIKTLSWCAIGRKYGVSDNAVRKWARKYKLIA